MKKLSKVFILKSSLRILILVSLILPINLTSASNSMNLPDFSGLVEQNNQSIVNISIVRKSSNNSTQPGKNDKELHEFFEKFFGDKGFKVPENIIPKESVAVGSGFIYSNDGFIVTNHHVISEANQIIVKLSDRREIEAKLIGSDPATDIAVLKIPANNLRPVKIGNSAKLKAGQWVLAIGSPFGFESTVTAGIVSAIGRSLPNDNYVPFIQTDVAINPGNSGGPLFNLNGEVIGVNAQIFSRSGGFMGLSFAIPIDVANNVIKQLIKYKKVRRGWLGIFIQEVTSNLAKSFGMGNPRGALISKIVSDGPASKSELKVGDIILKFDNTDIIASYELPPIVANTPIGNIVNVQVLRKGFTKIIKFKVEELPNQNNITTSKAKESNLKTKNILGMVISDIPEKFKKDLNLENVSGIYVSEVLGDPALESGLLRNDIIHQLSGIDVKDIEQFEKIVNKMQKNQYASLLVRRGENNFLYLALKIQ